MSRLDIDRNQRLAASTTIQADASPRAVAASDGVRPTAASALEVSGLAAAIVKTLRSAVTTSSRARGGELQARSPRVQIGSATIAVPHAIDCSGLDERALTRATELMRRLEPEVRRLTPGPEVELVAPKARLDVDRFIRQQLARRAAELAAEPPPALTADVSRPAAPSPAGVFVAITKKMADTRRSAVCLTGAALCSRLASSEIPHSVYLTGCDAMFLGRDPQRPAATFEELLAKARRAPQESIAYELDRAGSSFFNEHGGGGTLFLLSDDGFIKHDLQDVVRNLERRGVRVVAACVGNADLFDRCFDRWFVTP